MYPFVINGYVKKDVLKVGNNDPNKLAHHQGSNNAAAAKEYRPVKISCAALSE